MNGEVAAFIVLQLLFASFLYYKRSCFYKSKIDRYSFRCETRDARQFTYNQRVTATRCDWLII